MRTSTYVFLLQLAFPISAALLEAPERIEPVNIDTQRLNGLKVFGSFEGIDSCRYKGQNSVLQEPQDGGDSIIVQTNQSVYLSLPFADGSVQDSCLLSDNRTLVVAGNFTKLFNTSSNGIGLLDLQNSTVLSMGMDSRDNRPEFLSEGIKALRCSGSKVYVGGDIRFRNGSGVAVFDKARNEWELPAFGGFDEGSIVNAIEITPRNTVLFGGNFTKELSQNGTHHNNTLTYISGSEGTSQILPLSQATVSATEAEVASNPYSLFCPGSPSFRTRPGDAGKSSTVSIDFGFTTTLNSIRLQNIRGELAGTSLFSVITTSPPGTIAEFMYFNETTGEMETCVQCRLSQTSEGGTSQEFFFVDETNTRSLNIELLDHYGDSAGLESVEFTEKDLRVRSDNFFNAPLGCQNINRPARSETSGVWNASGEFLTAIIESSQDLESTSLRLFPKISETANYSLILNTPGCLRSSQCNTHQFIEATVYPFGLDSEGISSLVSQTNAYEKETHIFTGVLNPNNQPFIEIKASNPVSIFPQEVFAPSLLVRFANQTEVEKNNRSVSNIFEFDPEKPLSLNNDVIYNELSRGFLKHHPVTALAVTNNATYVGVELEQGGLLTVEEGRITFNSLRNISQFLNFNESVLAVSDLGVYDVKSGIRKTQGAKTATSFNNNGTELLVLNTTEFTPLNNLRNAFSVKGRISTRVEATNGTLYFGSLQITRGNEYVASIDENGEPQSSALNFEIGSNSNLRRRESDNIPNGVKAVKSLNNGTIVYAGRFSATINNSFTENVVLVNQTGMFGLPNGIDSASSIEDIDVENSTVVLAGHISGDVNGHKIRGVAVYNHSSEAFAETQPPGLDGSDPVARHVLIFPNTSHALIIGHFSGAAGFKSPNTCILNFETGEWSAPDSVLSARSVISHAELYSTREVLLTGSILFQNKTLAQMAVYNFNTNRFLSVPGGDDLPGPPKGVALGNTTRPFIFACGSDSKGEEYLKWKYLGPKGSSWSSFPVPSGSILESVSILPVTQGQSVAPLGNHQVLVATGNIMTESFGRVGAAVFDGNTWKPWMATGGTSGDSSSTPIKGLWSGMPYRSVPEAERGKDDGDHHRRGSKHRPAGHVVGISFAIALGCVSLLILVGVSCGIISQRRYMGYEPAVMQSEKTFPEQTGYR